MDAILAGLSGLGDVAKSAIPTISAIQQMENDRTRLGFEKDRVGMEQTRLGMEQEKQGWEKEKFLRDKAIAEMPVNFSQMIGNTKYRKPALDAMMNFYKINYPETYKQFNFDDVTGDLWGPNYLKQVVMTDAERNAKFKEALHKSLMPTAELEAKQLRDEKEKIIEKGTNDGLSLDAIKNDKKYIEVASKLKKVEEEYNAIARLGLAGKQQEEQMKADIDMAKQIEIRHGEKAKQFQAIQNEADLNKAKTSASIAASASKYSADVHAKSAENVALLNRDTQLEKVDRQGKIIIQKAEIAAGKKGGGLFDKKPKNKVEQENSAKTYNNTIIDSINKLPAEERGTTARNILSKVTDKKARIELAKELISRGLITLEDINQ
jgi:hypothetical protein